NPRVHIGPSIWIQGVCNVQEFAGDALCDKKLGHGAAALAEERVIRTGAREQCVACLDTGSSLSAHQAESNGGINEQCTHLLRKSSTPPTFCQTYRDLVPRLPTKVRAACFVLDVDAPDRHDGWLDQCFVRHPGRQLLTRRNILLCEHHFSRGVCFDTRG